MSIATDMAEQHRTFELPDNIVLAYTKEDVQDAVRLHFGRQFTDKEMTGLIVALTRANLERMNEDFTDRVCDYANGIGMVEKDDDL